MRERPELTKNAVEEFLRYDTSVQISHRVVLDGARLDDTEIPERAMVYTLNGAVNRDPDRFADPDRLDITRDIPHHLAFSFGAVLLPGGRPRPPRDGRRDPGPDRPVPHPAPGHRVVRVAGYPAAPRSTSPCCDMVT